jgi:hypothetical protein
MTILLEMFAGVPFRLTACQCRLVVDREVIGRAEKSFNRLAPIRMSFA